MTCPNGSCNCIDSEEVSVIFPNKSLTHARLEMDLGGWRVMFMSKNKLKAEHFQL